MKRLERLTALLTYLQSRRGTTIQRLVERFEMSERTLYRDLRALEESGVPLGFEKERGYYVLDRHFLPPLALSVEEAKALVLAEQIAQKYLDVEFLKPLGEALDKVRQKLQDTQLADVESLQSRVLTYVNPAYEPRYLQQAEAACAQRLVLQLGYVDARDRYTKREVEPIGLSFYGQAWHLIGWCRLRGAYRDFSLARVQDLEASGEHFTTAHVSLREYIQQLENSENR